MSWSITVARAFGSEIRIHLTFLLLLVWIGAVYYQQGGADAALFGVVFISSVFACVLLHELGHALAARRYGIRTPDITLLPIGGLARLERMPEKPMQEIVIAIAGPLVNVVIAAVLIMILGGLPMTTEIDIGETTMTGFLSQLAAVNIILVLFNMIPAFPMDGGRVLRAVLALNMNRARATRIAARIGQVIAVGFAAFGFASGNFILILIAVFIYLAATAESETTGLMDMARRMTVDRAMIRAFEALVPGATIDDAADALLRTTQKEFPVIDADERLIGALSRDQMIHALRESGAQTPVLDVMTREVPTVRRGTRLDRALRDLQGTQAPLIGVVADNGRLDGYLSQENIMELMLLDGADWHQSASVAAARPGTGVPRLRNTD